MREVRTKLTEGSNITIPAEYLEHLGVQIGDEVILSLQAGEISIFTPQQAIKRAQALVRRYIPEGRSLSDELIAERRFQS